MSARGGFSTKRRASTLSPAPLHQCEKKNGALKVIVRPAQREFKKVGTMLIQESFYP